MKTIDEEQILNDFEEAFANHEEGTIRLLPPHREAVKRFIAARFIDDTVVKREWFYEALGIDFPHEDMAVKHANPLILRFLSQFEKMRQELLLVHNIHLESVQGRGYRVLPPEEQTEAAFECAFNGVDKFLRKGMDRLQHSQVEKMTDQQRDQNIKAQTQMAILLQSYHQQRKMPELPGRESNSKRLAE